MAERLFPVLLVFLLVAAACGGQEDNSDDAFGSEIAAVDTTPGGDDAASSDGSTLAVEGGSESEDDAAPDAAAGSDSEGKSTTVAGGEGTSSSDASGSSTPAGGSDGAGGDDSDSQSGDTTGSSDSGDDDSPTTTEAATATTEAPATTARPSTSGAGVISVDWWGCWQARDAVTNGSTVSRLPNCASGPSSVGSVGDMFGSANPPIYRASGAGGVPSIEFTHAGDTLLQTNGGQAWGGGDVLQSGQGVTMAWIGMMLDVNSHEGKFLVAGQSRDNRFPAVRVRGRGQNRFEAYGGGSAEALSSNGSVVDNRLHGVIVYLAPDRSASVIELDGSETRGGQDSQLRRNVFGLTLGNSYDRNFSTTDHQFVFLGMKQGQMTSAEKAAFWGHLESLR